MPIGDDPHPLHARALASIHDRHDVAVAKRPGAGDVERLVATGGEDVAQARLERQERDRLLVDGDLPIRLVLEDDLLVSLGRGGRGLGGQVHVQPLL